MRTMGIRLGDAVLLIERRGEQELVYKALVMAISMDEKLAGTHGEPAISASFVDDGGLPLATVHVVHVSHPDFVEGRVGLGYEEQPGSRGRERR